MHIELAGDTLVIKNEDELAQAESIRSFFRENPFRLTGIFNMQVSRAPGAEKLPDTERQEQKILSLFNQTVEEILKRVQPNEEDAFWGLLNVIDNLPEYSSWPDIHEFKNLYKGQMGVAVSTGPSLKFILPELKKQQDHVIIFACDSAVKGLLKEGITPDFVATTERIGDAYHLFKDLPPLSNTPLLSFSVVPQKALASYPGPKLKMDWEYGFTDCFGSAGEKIHLGNSPSVSHLCYWGLRILGCEKIILAGQDLSFDSHSGKSHTDHVDDFLLQVGSDLIEINGSKTPVYDVQGYDGRPKRTTLTWHNFAKSFGHLIARYGGEVLHALPPDHGIPIAGARRVDPIECLAHLSSHPPDKNLHAKIIKNFKSPAPDFSEAQKTWAALNDFCKISLSTMRQISQTWRDHDVRVKDRDHENFYRDFFAGLDRQLEELKKIHENFFEKKFLVLIMNSFLGLLIEKQQQIHGNPDFVSRTLELIQIHFKIFNLIQLWATRVLEAMGEGVLFAHKGEK